MITFIRTDISGPAVTRHLRLIQTYCARHRFAVLESIEADADRWPNPGPVLRDLARREAADAVIIPGGDHLGAGVDLVTAVALVIAVESRLMWLPGGLAMQLP